METPRLPPRAGTFPTVNLGDGRWEHVIAALRRSGTKRDDRLADVIDKQVQQVRRSRAERAVVVATSTGLTTATTAYTNGDQLGEPVTW